MKQDLCALARRLVVGLAGPALTPAEKRWLDHWQPAGVILFARNCRSLVAWKRLIAELREVLPPGGECCVDHEGGAVSFLQALAGRPPALRTLGDLDDVSLTRRVHRETAARLRELGLDRVLAPCCDVLREPASPVIGARSFGVEPGLVAAHAAAAMEGLASAGLKGCAKHWPGHGGTRTDTHETGAGLQVAPGGSTVEAKMEVRATTGQGTAARVVRAADEQPFLAALAAGADALMIAHLPTALGRLPLTLDAEGLARLRERFQTPTLLFSDDVSMGALRAPLASLGVAAPDARTCGLVEPADLPAYWLLAVAEAGCDRLLLRGIPWRALPLPSVTAANTAAITVSSPDLRRTGPPSLVYAEARQHAARNIALRHGVSGLLWFDATGGDRFGEAVCLLPVIRAWWPGMVRFDAAAPEVATIAAVTAEAGTEGPFARILVTAHRPLTAGQTHRLHALAASKGVVLAAGHPSLASDLGHLLGHDWHVDALYDCAEPDLSPLTAFTAASTSQPFDSL